MEDTKKLIEKYKRELMELSAASQKRKPEQTPIRESKTDAPRTENQAKTPKIIGYVDGDNSAYDKFLAELGKTPDSDITISPADNGQPTARLSEDPVTETEESVPLESDPAGEPNCAGEYESDNEPEIIHEPDGEINEIIDETEPMFTPPRYNDIPSTQEVRENITETSDPRNNYPEENVSGVTDNSATTPRADVADTLTTSEEQAERLNDQPVSGTDPNEQLTGRSFEGEAPPPASDISMEGGSRAEPVDYPETNYDSYADYEKANTGRGSLMFRVYTGREAVVIEGAECVITKKINGGIHTIATLTTDSSGQTPVQELPAPSKELSQHPENTIQPFALYDATVTKPGFVRIVLKDVPVFDGVQSVQRVFMIVDS